MSRRTFARIEHGQADALTLDTLRTAFVPFGAKVRTTVWWPGAEIDRLLDEKHARLVEHLSVLFSRRGWLIAPEVTFSECGERGSMDLLGFHPPTGAAALNEVKTAFGSIEETNRRLDVKVRLAPKIVADRFGVTPASVSRLLVLPDDDPLRRVVATHAATFQAIYPARAREIGRWPRTPTTPINGLWFVSDTHHRATGTDE